MKSAAYEFAKEADCRAEALTAADYRAHRGAAKRLLEEVIPISRLALYLKEPGLHVEVEAFESDGPRDGRIIISGYRELDIDVEVTCTYSYEERLRADLLNTEGVAPGAGKIVRDRATGQITGETIAVDIDEHFARIASEVVDRAGGKASWNSQRDSVLIVAFDEIRLVRGYGWLRLYKELQSMGGVPRGPFKAAYLFNAATAELQQAF